MNVMPNRTRIRTIANTVQKRGPRVVELLQAAIGVLGALIAFAGIVMKAVEVAAEETDQPIQG